MPQRHQKPLAELHNHLGSAVHPSILWSIAHRQGIRLPTKDYWAFEQMITMHGNQKNRDLDQMHFNFFYWTELIQSSPEAIEESVQSTIGGAYRKCNVVVHELRFDPMRRNRKGERDLDHIIQSSLWGMERASLEYPQVKAGIIIMMHRMDSYKLNEIKVHKAIKYRDKGVIGIDVAGPERKSFSMKRHAKLFQEARAAGLGLTIHTGEAGSLKELKFVVREIQPERIGHGILCVKDPRLMKEIAAKGIVLEICPTSNLRNSIIKDVRHLKQAIRALLKYKVKFTINTDGPEMYQSNLLKEQELLRSHKILTPAEIERCVKWSFEASFVK
jgi:adenosine deaminase